MLECCRQDTKEAMICIDNKYALIKFTNLYQINHDFSYFSTKTSHVTGSILNSRLSSHCRTPFSPNNIHAFRILEPCKLPVFCKVNQAVGYKHLNAQLIHLFDCYIYTFKYNVNINKTLSKIFTSN